MPRPEMEPRALEDEIAFLIEHTRKYLSKDPQRSDIRSIYAGLRPLVKSSATKSTARLARDHVVLVSDSGLVTITGGKWTTYRHMAEDAVDTAVKASGLPFKPCVTATLPLHGAEDTWKESAPLDEITSHAVREEMARTVEDVLSRRRRLLLLDAHAAIGAAPAVAELLAKELHKDEAWQHAQVAEFTELARGYLP